MRYAINHNDYALYRYNADWSNPTVLWRTDNAYRMLGITYDPSGNNGNGSFWFGSWGNGTIYEYSMGGQILKSFAAGDNHTTALALDHADDTLWGFGWDRKFRQYNKSGQILQTLTPSQISQGVLSDSHYFISAEFNYAIPEPGTFILLGFAFIILFYKKN